MASAAERLAANVNFGAFAKATELKKRIWFTLGALIVYRFGTYIPIPGVDASILAEVFAQQQGGVLGLFDMFAGGALSRMSIFALNIMPYISAAIIMQLLTAVSPKLEALRRKANRAGRRSTSTPATARCCWRRCRASGLQAAWRRWRGRRDRPC